jgi:hypothetical protein
MKLIKTTLAHHPLARRRMNEKSGIGLSQDWLMATLMTGIGFAPISALALSLMGISTLPVATLVLVLPALVTALSLCCRRRGYGRLMRHGFFMGIVAVGLYDCIRIPFTMAGWLNDFIPNIGVMLVGEGSHHMIVGYLWRYLGNGGGLGIAFVSTFALLAPRFPGHRNSRLPPRTTSMIALGFGTAVWVCLVVTLVISPRGEEIMFVLSPLTLLLSLIGHLVFGQTLGCLVNRFPQARPGVGESF